MPEQHHSDYSKRLQKHQLNEIEQRNLEQLYQLVVITTKDKQGGGEPFADDLMSASILMVEQYPPRKEDPSFVELVAIDFINRVKSVIETARAKKKSLADVDCGLEGLLQAGVEVGHPKQLRILTQE